jgi:hypothetical protein
MCFAWLSFLLGSFVLGFSVFVYRMSFCICMMRVTTTRAIDLCGVVEMDGCVDLGVLLLCRCVSSYSSTFQFSSVSFL